MIEPRLRVLILCTGNSARSQMAEALLRHLANGAIEVESAGSTPQPEIHEMARVAVGKLFALDMARQHPKPLANFLGQRFDYVITVCDRAAESCPVFPGAPERIHWSCDDPAAVVGSDTIKQRAFDVVAGELVRRIRLWLSLPAVSRRLNVPQPHS
jgi:protein-tyrosine-phosphatase